MLSDPLIQIVLGALAVVLPLPGFFLRRSAASIGLSLASFACAFACQVGVVATFDRFAQINDAVAIYDTVGAYLFCSALLSVIVMILNAALLWRVLIRPLRPNGRHVQNL